MTTQLSIECDVINQSNYNDTLKDYETQVKLKELHPVHLIFNKKDEVYFVGRHFKKETWESMSMYVVVK